MCVINSRNIAKGFTTINKDPTTEENEKTLETSALTDGKRDCDEEWIEL